MPSSFGYTNAQQRGHGLFVDWRLPDDQWWGYVMAAIPAALVYILFFVKTEIIECVSITEKQDECKKIQFL